MRLIDADTLLDILAAMIVARKSASDVYDVVDSMPTIEAEPIRHGHWIVAKYPLFTCSECGAIYQEIGYGYDYCPNCGAKMDEEEKQ